MSNILVTGINGFVGKHLAHELNAQGHSVYGLGHIETMAHPEIQGILKDYRQCDLTKEEDVGKLPLENLDSIINLAGLAAVGPSFDNPDLYMKVNVEVVSVLGKAILERNPSIRVLAISSGALYDPRQPLPLSEDAKLSEQTSPYAMSKIAMEKTCGELRDQGLDVVIARPFNHIGPGQEQGFLLPDLYEKLSSQAKSGKSILVGNLETKRDYTDVRDITKAYVALATSKKLSHYTYNVCSGSSTSGKRILELLCTALGLSQPGLKLDTDKNLIRPNDPMEIFGNNSLLKTQLGWSPSIDIEKTIKDFVESKQDLAKTS